MEECIFCKIINKEIPKEFRFESDTLVAFDDISPSADVHILIVPRVHIEKMLDLNKNHSNLLVQIFEVVNRLVQENNLSGDSYRLVVNGGRAQHVPHLHFHLLGGQWKKMV
ncbi:HIT domain-containing protein [Candidatus Daviesbacteria bacterium]|nr:HIT domain-containing protein [Candidatus Daviesbacteria bacterium]